MEKNIECNFYIYFYKSKHGTIDRLSYNDKYTEEDFKTWLKKSRIYMNEEYGKFYYDNTLWSAWFTIYVRDTLKNTMIPGSYIHINLDDIHDWEDIEKHIPMVTSLFNTYSSQIKE